MQMGTWSQKVFFMYAIAPTPHVTISIISHYIRMKNEARQIIFTIYVYEKWQELFVIDWGGRSRLRLIIFVRYSVESGRCSPDAPLKFLNGIWSSWTLIRMLKCSFFICLIKRFIIPLEYLKHFSSTFLKIIEYNA